MEQKQNGMKNEKRKLHGWEWKMEQKQNGMKNEKKKLNESGGRMRVEKFLGEEAEDVGKYDPHVRGAEVLGIGFLVKKVDRVMNLLIFQQGRKD